MKLLALLSSAAVASANLVTYPNGAVAPAKTPEVLAAEAAHFAAKGAVPAPYFGYNGFNGYNGYFPGAYAGAYAYGAGYAPLAGYNAYPYAAPLVGHLNGAVVPADTPAVHAAKVEHFAAKGEVYAAHGLAAPALAPYTYAHAYAPAAYAHPGLVAHPNGAVVPVEPLDVVEARAEHLAAHAAA